MAFEIELKEDSPEKLAAVADKPTKHYLFAPELMALVEYINGLDLEQILQVNNSSNLGIEVAGLTISNKINFITGLITQLRNVRFQDKDGDVALTSDIATLSQNIASKQSVELLLTDADVIKSGGLPRISGLTNQGHTLVQGSRVLLTGPSFPEWNGLYRVGSGPLMPTGQYNLNRTSDAVNTASLNNALVSVTNGTFAGKTYIQTTPNPIVNTTPIVFEEFGGASVALATNILAGIAKLYNALGSQIDGGITPKAVTDAMALKADLVDGLVPSSQLPSYVDDILVFDNLAGFPSTGEAGKVYIAVSPKNLQYRWTGSGYIAITNGLIASTNDVPEGSNLYYTDARVNALLALFKIANYLDATSSIQGQLNAISTKTQVGNQTTDITTSSTTKTNTTIIFNVEANSVYAIEGYIYGGCSVSGGVRIGWTLPVGCSGIQSIISVNANTLQNGFTSGAFDINNDISGFATSSNVQQSRYVATLITGANAGTITLGFGTNTAGQGSIFRTGSNFLIVKK